MTHETCASDKAGREGTAAPHDWGGGTDDDGAEDMGTIGTRYNHVTFDSCAVEYKAAADYGDEKLAEYAQANSGGTGDKVQTEANPSRGDANEPLGTGLFQITFSRLPFRRMLHDAIVSPPDITSNNYRQTLPLIITARPNQ